MADVSGLVAVGDKLVCLPITPPPRQVLTARYSQLVPAPFQPRLHLRAGDSVASYSVNSAADGR